MNVRILGAFESTRVVVALLVILSAASSAQSLDTPELQPSSQSIAELQNNFEACATAVGCGVDDPKRSATASPEITSSPIEISVRPLRLDDQGAKPEPDISAPHPRPIDYGRTLYYKNKTEFGLDVGWLLVNIPFAFDVFLGDGYNKTPLNYTLVPIIASLRWQMDDVGGRWIFRGNWDLQASLGVVPIARGPETHYVAWIMGIRRNFVPRRGKIDPYFDFRLGLGGIDAKEPLGVMFAQGQNFTFTINVGSGIRYNFNQKYSISAGINYMHISNAYISEPAFSDYGINVYGPMVGMNIRLGRTHHASE